jgi:hypothetical protein
MGKWRKKGVSDNWTLSTDSEECEHEQLSYTICKKQLQEQDAASEDQGCTRIIECSRETLAESWLQRHVD